MKKGEWSFISDGSMVRFSGYTFPAVTYVKADKKIYARNSNGGQPSDTKHTEDLSLDGLKRLVNATITGKLPTEADYKKFMEVHSL